MYKQPYNTPSGYRMCSPWSLKNLGTCLTLRNHHTPCILHVFLSVAENSGDSWQPASSPPLRQHQTDLLSLTWLGALGCFPIWPLVSIDCIALGQATNHFNYVLIASWMHCHSSSSGFTKCRKAKVTISTADSCCFIIAGFSQLLWEFLIITATKTDPFYQPKLFLFQDDLAAFLRCPRSQHPFFLLYSSLGLYPLVLSFCLFFRRNHCLVGWSSLPVVQISLPSHWFCHFASPASYSFTYIFHLWLSLSSFPPCTNRHSSSSVEIISKTIPSILSPCLSFLFRRHDVSFLSTFQEDKSWVDITKYIFLALILYLIQKIKSRLIPSS